MKARPRRGAVLVVDEGGEVMSTDWTTWETRYRYWSYPTGWTYRKPMVYPRTILLRGNEQPIGRIHRALDEDGRVWYRIDGTYFRFALLGSAGDALFARHCIENKRSRRR